MKKRIISITLLLSLLLSACGSGTGETSADTTSGEPELSSDEAQTGEYKKPSVDYKGAEFTVIDRKMENPMWIASGYSNIEAEEENGEPINDAQYKRNRQVEEELNIKLVQYSTEAAECANELRKLVLAGEDAVDAAMVRGNTMFTLLGEENLLTSFNDIPTMDTEASWWDQNASETFTFGGELMAITGDLSLFTSFAPVLMFINKEVAESHGIGDCYELVREGKWTWDKVMEMCELAAHDLNGDSKMDENDAYGMALQTGLLADSLISCGGRFTNSTPGGIELVLNNERTAAVVEKIVPFVYAPETDKAAIAKFAPIALEQAAQGDEAAWDILRREAEELAQLVSAVQQRLEMPKCRIALLGGLIATENPYREAVADRLTYLGTVVSARHNALWGAAQMAWELN